MTERNVASRNRKNARKSTGPKTPEGKKTVSQNAVRHGATSRPDPSQVSTWLRIISGDPDMSLDRLEQGGDLEYRALALAEAEVKLHTAEKALAAFEEREREIDKELKRLATAGAIWIGGLLEGYSNPTDEIFEILRLDQDDITELKRTKRLLKRYAAEAKSQRRRAFRTWVRASRQQ